MNVLIQRHIWQIRYFLIRTVANTISKIDQLFANWGTHINTEKILLESFEELQATWVNRVTLYPDFSGIVLEQIFTSGTQGHSLDTIFDYFSSFLGNNVCVYTTKV